MQIRYKGQRNCIFPELGYQCDGCDRTFEYLKELRKHRRTHSEMFYKCKFCPSSFVRFTGYRGKVSCQKWSCVANIVNRLLKITEILEGITNEVIKKCQWGSSCYSDMNYWHPPINY